MDISTNLGNVRVLLRITVTQYRDVKYDESNRPSPPPRRTIWRSIIAAISLAALVGLGMWLGTSLFRSSDSITVESSELTPSQHTEHLVRVLRISAASDTTPSNIRTIPETISGFEPIACGSRYAQMLDQALVQLHGIDYFSTVAGARAVDTQTWRIQQTQAHDSAVALQSLFPEECAPVVPVAYDLPVTYRNADGIGIQQMLKVSDTLVEEWSQLYLLAETAQERELALAGLWQAVSWEATWQPGRSPFAFGV